MSDERYAKGRTYPNPELDRQWADYPAPTLRVNRRQPVNAYGLKAPRDKDGNVLIEQTVPNVIPTIKLEA